MFEIDPSVPFSQVAREAQPGLTIALSPHDAYLFLKTSDRRPIEWNSKYYNLSIFSLNSLETQSPVEFSVLAMFVILWQSALPGAKHFTVSGFFDFFDVNTVKWLQAAITNDRVDIISLFEDNLFSHTSIVLGYQNLRPHFQNVLERGLKAVEELKQIFDEDIFNFQETKEFLFSVWPDDPYETFFRSRRS